MDKTEALMILCYFVGLLQGAWLFFLYCLWANKKARQQQRQRAKSAQLPTQEKSICQNPG